MRDGVQILGYTSIGDIIRNYRKAANLSLTQLAHLSNIQKGVISKIENGETKRPELKTLKSIAAVLDIPYQEFVEHYIEIEQRVEALRSLLLETITFDKPELLTKVALKFVESPNEDTCTLLEKLFQIADSVDNSGTKLLLVDVIIRYAREHGVPQYVGKGLLRKYLIERADLSRLEESFRIGEEILHYEHFLPTEERVVFYYRLGLHAHNIKRYRKCIQFGKTGLALDQSTSELTARICLAICNSYIFLKEYDQADHYLSRFEKCDFPFVKDSATHTRAVLYSRRGDYNKAAQLFEESLSVVPESARIHVINELLQIYLQTNDIGAANKIFDEEQSFLINNTPTPFLYIEIGNYYKYKGAFALTSGMFADAISYYIRGMEAFATIDALDEVRKCTREVFIQYERKELNIEFSVVKELVSVYNLIEYKKSRSEE